MPLEPTRSAALLARLRRRSAPVAVSTIASFALTTLQPVSALADPSPRSADSPAVNESTVIQSPAPEEAFETSARGGDSPKWAGFTRADVSDAFRQTTSAAATFSAAKDLLALPTGDKSGVTTKTISVPNGSGTTQGMGESFSAQLSTGIATFSFPLKLPAGRGGVSPELALSYSSAAGLGIAGLGWDASVPFIARQTDRGVPRYNEGSRFNPDQDRFSFNGGQELVPICVVDAGLGCAGALSFMRDTGSGQVQEQEAMPVWAAGWQYFRPRVEGSYLRFFWSPDHRTWRVQSKDGTCLELGVPLDGSGYTDALERNPDRTSEIYRWFLARKYDAYGSANPASGNPKPVNVVVYRYSQDGGTAYLSDIFDTTPASNSTTTALDQYAHHTRLVYETRSDPTQSYRAGWKVDRRLRLARVDVSSKSFNGGVSGARHLVRRYRLAYDPAQHLSELASVELEGRCTGSEDSAPAEGSNQQLPDATNCPRLPAVSFGYTHVTPLTTSGAPGLADLTGYEGFDERIHTIAQSPPHSIDEDQADFFDVNADSLPDLLVTAPGTYGSAHGVFFNGDAGKRDSFGAPVPMGVSGVIGANADSISFSNPDVAALDLDGDGRVDFVHMPAVKTYGVYAPTLGATGWVWQGRAITTASGQSPKISFATDTLNTKVVDVNFDGLVDVVVSTGTELQTFFSLGRYPGGDGQFGSAVRTGATTASLSNDPVRSCVPSSSLPISFSDPDVRLADMNGDGIVDIVRVRKGDMRYWPGRGNGFWGTGKRDDCPAGTFGDNRHIAMSSSPDYPDVEATDLHLEDVNGDGLADLVEVGYTNLDVWLNVDGVSWTPRHIVQGSPANPGFAPRIRLLDVNGSGTLDVVWGNASQYQYIDLAGKRPGLLAHVENGLGKTTDVEYGTSTEEMLAAEQSGRACDPANPWGSGWCSKMPLVAQVVKRVTDSDNLTVTGRAPGRYVTEYTYRDPVYEGRQREFRGFRRVRSRRVGDANSPTDVTESTLLLGECADENPSDSVDACALSERWRDNPREALKGLPVVTERYDEATGVYLSTEHTSYRLRRLYTGLDGREVRDTFAEGKTSFLYDTANRAAFGAGPTTRTLTSVDLEPVPGGSTTTAITTGVPVRASVATAEVTSSAVIDPFGNAVTSTELGCTGGGACPSADEAITKQSVSSRPAQDGTGWMWREVESFVTGSAHPATGVPTRWKDTLTTYNAEGDPIELRAVLSGTLPLLRFHELSTAAVAPPPALASADGTIQLATLEYDAFGNTKRETGPNGRCREVSYEGSLARQPLETATGYDALPTLEIVYTQGCGTGGLTTSAAYDRGLGVPTIVDNMQLQPTRTDFDGFGRPIAVTRANPAQPGVLHPAPSKRIEYFLPPDLGGSAYSLVHTLTQDDANPNAPSDLESWQYIDGLGRTILTLNDADPSKGDAGSWIAVDLSEYDAKSAVSRKYLASFYSQDPKHYPFSSKPASPSSQKKYDAFARPRQSFDLDGTETLETRYHALSQDAFDAADLAAGPEATPATEARDGHGRASSTSERTHDGSAIEERQTRTSYVPTGEPETITRVRVGRSDPPVIRWMRYDTLGRLLLNAEPNTTTSFTADPTASVSSLATWRYAYDDAGDLVGTSDARGCGVNYAYDQAGRLVTEDYSPCRASHEAYTAPNLTGSSGPEGMEVLYFYDSAPDTALTGLPRPPGFIVGSQDYFKGKLVAVFDRGRASWTSYDGLGRPIQRFARMAVPGASAAVVPSRYAPRWYLKSYAYDAMDREISCSTGATTPELLGTDGQSTVTSTYSQRGTLWSVGGSYGPLVSSVTRDADGPTTQIAYGDAAATTTAFSYDARRRLRNQITYRPPPALWSNPPADYLPAPTPNAVPPTTFQMVLQDQDYVYDVVGNPLYITDWRTASEWPTGSKPVTRQMTYDDLYRVTRIDYDFGGGDDAWTSPFAAENSGDATLADPRRPAPMPQLSFANRLRSQTFGYDWLGNTSQTGDDVGGFYDRSLGTVQNGTAAAGPYQLKSANNKITPLPTRNGSVATQYDAAGNLIRLNLERNGPCVPTGAQCSARFAYDWDEVGRLVQAQRWDTAAQSLGTPESALPSTTPDADLRYQYDASNERSLKTAVEGAGSVNTVYVFDSLELRRAAFTSGDYALTPTTAVAYLSAHGTRLAELFYDDTDVPLLAGARLHTLFELGDQLGSGEVVLDKATSELVERSTYQAYGAAESDYRPDRWKGFRADYRFTGKEEDVEVGLDYFGKRFYAPMLDRWVSADPLAVQKPGEADLNLYAYVHGAVLKAIDPVGLNADPPPAPVSEGEAEGEKDDHAAAATMEKAHVAVHVVETVAEEFAEHTTKSFPVPVIGSQRTVFTEYKYMSVGERVFLKSDRTFKATHALPKVLKFGGWAIVAAQTGYWLHALHDAEERHDFFGIWEAKQKLALAGLSVTPIWFLVPALDIYLDGDLERSRAEMERAEAKLERYFPSRREPDREETEPSWLKPRPDVREAHAGNQKLLLMPIGSMIVHTKDSWYVVVPLPPNQK